MTDVWWQVGPILARAVPSAGGRYTLADILRECCAAEQQLWIAFADDKQIVGALTTRFIDYPGKRMLSGQFCAGTEIKQWARPMLDTLYRWARDTDCKGFEMTGRKGWQRFLAADGWQATYTVFERNI